MEFKKNSGKSYITAVPIMNALSDSGHRGEYLEQFKSCGISRVFLCPRNSFADDEYRAGIIEALEQNIEFYKKNGLEVGVWFGGLGHGGGLFRNECDRVNTKNFTRIVDLASGAVSEDSLCPLDDNFKKIYFSYIKAAASLSPDLIMIDDDFRMALHGAVSIGCACEKHMAEYSSRLGRKITREELSTLVYSGGHNEYRDLWLSVIGDSLRSFARGLRETVDSVAPNVRLGHCACFPTWDADGTDNIELSRIFAGNTRPFLRFIGAPYWFPNSGWINSLGNVVELERMQQNWCEKYAPDIEIFSEGDVYPRPRYVVPSSYVEGFDGALRASGGMDGILKYIVSYDSEPSYETGYIDHHIKNQPMLKKISEAFKDGNAVGLHMFEHMHKVGEHDFTVSPIGASDLFFPSAQKLLCAASVPSTYDENDDDGLPAVIFGDNAKYIGKRFTKLPLILDIKAAKYLEEQGIDTGIISCERVKSPERERFSDYGYGVSISSGGSFYRTKMKSGAIALSVFENDSESYPSAYLYENQGGRRFMIYTFDAYEVHSHDAIFRSYGRQAQLIDAIKWLTRGKSIPTVIRKAPGAYILCKKADNKLTVGVWNFWSDPITDPIIELDGQYEKAEFIENSGILEGRFIKLKNDIAPFGFACFSVI